jgi:hypothetical protein
MSGESVQYFSALDIYCVYVASNALEHWMQAKPVRQYILIDNDRIVFSAMSSFFGRIVSLE